MKVTMLNTGSFLGGDSWSPGDHLDRAPKHVQPLVDIGAAVEGHHDMTPKAARLIREHRLPFDEIKGTGQGGRVLVSDVRAFMEDEEPAPIEDEEDA